MKEKKTVALGLLDVIEVLGLSHEEIVLVAKEMVERFALTPAECFPQQKTSATNAENTGKVEQSEQSSVVPRKGFSKNGKRLGRPPREKITPSVSDDTKVSAVSEKAVKTEPSAQSSPTEAKEQKPYVFTRKGYSKNGVRLGRPPKDSSRARLLPPVPKGTDDKGETVSVVPEKPLTAEVSAAGVEQNSLAPIEKAVEKTKPVSFEEEVENLKYGREYSLDALYMYKGRMVRTNRVMSDARPLGIFIPHLRRCGYREFLLYYADESAGLTRNMADAYARNKLPKYQNQQWKIKEPWYDGAIKEVLEEANMLLKKMGGDKFEGKYFNPADSYFAQVDLTCKFRYVCDVL